MSKRRIFRGLEVTLFDRAQEIAEDGERVSNELVRAITKTLEVHELYDKWPELVVSHGYWWFDQLPGPRDGPEEWSEWRAQMNEGARKVSELFASLPVPAI